MTFVSKYILRPLISLDQAAGMNRKESPSSRVEDVPNELMHNIQSRLPVKEAARTSVLSKSWLHAWSTIPHLRFHLNEEQDIKLVDVDRTLTRYIRNNIPIETFELSITIENEDAASLAKKWIRSVAPKTSLKQLSLTISIFPWGALLILLDETLSGQNLTNLRVSVRSRGTRFVCMKTTRHPKCLSLRELHLSGVRTSEKVLHDIFSSCSLLVKIELLQCSRELKAIKVKNLPCLYQLQIVTLDGGSTAFEINQVPNLRFFECNVRMKWLSKRHGPLINAHLISLGSSVTDLTLGGGMIRDNTSLDMIIKWGIPFLESLTLDMDCWTLGSFHFSCASIKRFSLLACPSTLANVVHVNAPKLLFFTFSGKTMPSFLFPDSSLEEIEIHLELYRVDASFFLKTREALMLSSRCKLHITTFNYGLPLQSEIDIDDLRSRLPFPPAINVQQLFFRTFGDECMWERSPFFVPLFEICHPDHVYAWPDSMLEHNNHFCKLMLKEVLEKNKNKTAIYWPHYLENVQIERPHNRKWETLTDSHTSFLEGPTPEDLPVKFILNWC